MPKPLLATFQRVNQNGVLSQPPLPVKFNPTEFTLSKGAQLAEVAIPGLDSPILQFVRGQAETLALDLFFDSTETGMGDSATSVTSRTDQFYALIKIDGKTHAPPVCFFTWGSEFPGKRVYTGTGSPLRNGFKCVVESVRQRFTLFSPQGAPLRATLTIQLKEYKTLAEQIAEINAQSADHSHTHLVQAGETLAQIAGTTYNDPSQWRAIAAANNLSDPLDLQPATMLIVPPLSN
jgi:hypothetical protein